MESSMCLSSAILSLCLSCMWLGVVPSISSAQTDTIKPGEELQFSEKLLVSAKGTFTLGFFSLESSSYLGIWYTTDASNKKVWVANRDKPISGTDANLTLDVDGKLMITHSGGDPIVLNSNQAARNSTATLLDSGNFVLEEFNSDGSVNEKLWASFENPTDTLLPGMKLGINLKTGRNWSLASWISEQVPAPGTFTLEWNGTQLVMKRRGGTYWSSGTLKDRSFEFIPSLNWNNIYSFNSVSNANEIYFSYSVPGVVSHWVLTWEGELFDTSRPVFVLNDQCNRYEEYPGCAVQNLPTCRTRKDGFMKQSVLRSGSPSSMKGNSSLGLSDCQAICWNNCSCTAYNSIHTNGTGCRFWSTKFAQALKDDANQEELYVLSSSRVTGSSWWIWVIIAGVVLVVLLLTGSLYYSRRKFRGEREMEEAALLELTTSNSFSDSKDVEHDGKRGAHDLKLFSFDSIVAATNNFSSENKLGEGGFGPVYKGKLPEGQEIAVKRLSRGSSQGLVEFKNEIRLIVKLQHMNLVRLLGCCIKGEEKMLIYEFMPNKSLDFFLFDLARRKILDWKRRHNIIEGIAQGLLYLHKYSRLRIIHRDLKASNILLDHDLNPKISDFGMARTFGRNASEANTNRIVGTYGYMPPEYAMEGIFSVKSDVYSFGVLLLEIVSGQKNKSFHHNHGAFAINLAVYAWDLWKEGTSLELVDPMLEDSYSTTQMLRCIRIALLCVQESATDRPTMSAIISMLTNETVPLPNPNLPAFSTHHKVSELDSHKGRPESCSRNVTISETEGR
ncbi:G-type lectin S-receptor-like serine/threonine-protein kinase CES101 isoform X1 [Vitis riparia]|uniref:G-type lectin S-receptor-like serine/threonine-protein kinase CES101 isoform X1 n=1 Tax=Vitis riparia TaxID=96939 RepID=UPI00155AF378|nr:G-type lectin S-receptor-like serine/threonine-protein kinase CES101 isoform X1 [Vitis riparia]